jgi:hypothetical protein
VTKIMKEARDLLKCERCAVFLVDLECCEAVMMKRDCCSLSALSIISTFCSSESFGANG